MASHTLTCESDFLVAGLQKGEDYITPVRILSTLFSCSVISAWFNWTKIKRLSLFFAHWLRLVGVSISHPSGCRDFFFPSYGILCGTKIVPLSLHGPFCLLRLLLPFGRLQPGVCAPTAVLGYCGGTQSALFLHFGVLQLDHITTAVVLSLLPSISRIGLARRWMLLFATNKQLGR